MRPGEHSRRAGHPPPCGCGGPGAGERGPFPRRGGFSLLELMVVIVLMGIMAAAIVPEMRGTYEDALLRGAARELAGVFNLAASRAVSLNQTLRVRLDAGTGRYAVERQAGSRARGGGFLPAKDVPAGQGELDTRLTIEIRTPDTQESDSQPVAAEAGETGEPRARADLEEAVVFHPDGTADPAEIVLRDRQGFRLALRINPATARVRIVELERP